MSVKLIFTTLLAYTAFTGNVWGDENGSAHSFPAKGRPEISALRYFAEQNQFDRYRAELQRLFAQYPDFVPPKDIFESHDADTQELWQLYSTGDFDALEAAIKQKKKEHPYWEPDENLTRYLASARNLEELVALYDSKDYDSVIDYMLAHKDLVTDGSPEVMWMLGEALAQLERPGAAVEAFENGFKENPTSTLLPILVQKAAENLPVADAQHLYKRVVAEIGKDQKEIELGFLRGLVLRTKDLAQSFPDHLLEKIHAFGEAAKADNRFDDLQNLAWAFYALADYEAASKWFSFVPNSRERVKALEGEILSLKHIGKIDPAFKLADDWDEASEGIAALFINLSAPNLLAEKARKLDPEFLKKYAAISNRLRSGEGAEALGWYAYNVKQLKTAEAWFSKAIEWELTETAAFGKTLTAARRKDRALFDKLKAKYSPEYKSVAGLKYKSYKRSQSVFKAAYKAKPSLSSKMAKSYRQGKYSKCLEIFHKLSKKGGIAAHDHQMHGWCLLKLDRPHEAKQAFAMAKAGIRSTDSKERSVNLYGASLAALKAGRIVEADRIARSGQLNNEQFRTVRIAVLAQQALATFRQNDYRQTLSLLQERARMVQEPANLAELRGWSLFKLGKYRPALTVFQQLDNRLSTNKTRRALRIVKDKLYPDPEVY